MLGGGEGMEDGNSEYSMPKWGPRVKKQGTEISGLLHTPAALTLIK
jgi:hypothetical protein